MIMITNKIKEIPISSILSALSCRHRYALKWIHINLVVLLNGHPPFVRSMIYWKTKYYNYFLAKYFKTTIMTWIGDFISMHITNDVVANEYSERNHQTKLLHGQQCSKANIWNLLQPSPKVFSL